MLDPCHGHYDGEHYHVDQRILSMVRFEFLNLALDVYPSYATGTKELDLILCRNVLIYFDQDTIRAVATRLFDSLSAGGWLITASGDPPLAEYAAFESVVTDHGVFLRRPVAAKPSALIAPPATFAKKTEDTKPAAIQRREPAWESDEPKSQAVSKATSQQEKLREAQQALMRGEYQPSAELSETLLGDPAASVVHLKALANVDTQRAVRCCEMLTERHSLSPELHYLHAVLLLELNLDVEAVQATERAIFLDRSLAVAHLLLGSILQRRGALQGARRAFRNARNLCKDRHADEPLPLAEDQTAGQLAAAAEIQLAAVEAALESKP